MPLAMKDVERGGGTNKKISWEGGGTGYQYLCTVEGEGGGGGGGSGFVKIFRVKKIFRIF